MIQLSTHLPDVLLYTRLTVWADKGSFPLEWGSRFQLVRREEVHEFFTFSTWTKGLSWYEPQEAEEVKSTENKPLGTRIGLSCASSWAVIMSTFAVSFLLCVIAGFALRLLGFTGSTWCDLHTELDSICLTWLLWKYRFHILGFYDWGNSCWHRFSVAEQKSLRATILS